MSFLDPKEQVMEVVLTQHGRKMLAKGLFVPKYYAFSDDEVDYKVSSFSQLTASVIEGLLGEGLATEDGFFLITEGGDFIITE